MIYLHKSLPPTCTEVDVFTDKAFDILGGELLVQYNLSHHTDPPRADEVYEKRGNISI